MVIDVFKNHINPNGHLGDVTVNPNGYLGDVTVYTQLNQKHTF